MTTTTAEGIRIRRIGGVAALVAAATSVFGSTLFATALADGGTGEPDADSVALLVDHQSSLVMWHLVILVVFGAVLVPLVMTLHELLEPRAPVVVRIASVFGVIWAALVLSAGMIANLAVGTLADLYETDPAGAESVWSALDTSRAGLGGGNEIVGGLWVMLVSVVALRSGALPRGLWHLGAGTGVAGIVTILPALAPLGAAFGLGLVAWLAWLGVVLLRAGDGAEGDLPHAARAAPGVSSPW